MKDKLTCVMADGDHFRNYFCDFLHERGAQACRKTSDNFQEVDLSSFGIPNLDALHAQDHIIAARFPDPYMNTKTDPVDSELAGGTFLPRVRFALKSYFPGHRGNMESAHALGFFFYDAIQNGVQGFQGQHHLIQVVPEGITEIRHRQHGSLGCIAAFPR